MSGSENLVVFKDPSRREAFWEEFDALLDRFPEIIEGMDGVLEGEMDPHGILYNPDSPKFWQGRVIVLSARNTDDWESLVTLDPPTQSRYLAQGMLSDALDQ